MKVLGIIGVIVGVAAILMGCYLQFAVAPEALIADAADEVGMLLGDSYYGTPQQILNQTAMEAKTDVGEYTLLAGGIAFLLSIVPAVKKQKIAWVGVVCGLFALFIGAAYGTHMFS